MQLCPLTVHLCGCFFYQSTYSYLSLYLSFYFKIFPTCNLFIFLYISPTHYIYIFIYLPVHFKSFSLATNLYLFHQPNHLATYLSIYSLTCSPKKASPLGQNSPAYLFLFTFVMTSLCTTER